MYFQLNIQDAAQSIRGKVRLQLNFLDKTWVVDEDRQGVWRRVFLWDEGTFGGERAGEIVLMDQGRKLLSFENAPLSGVEQLRREGTATIIDAKDASYKNGRIQWSTDGLSSVISQVQPMSDLRVRLLKRIRELMPAKLGGSEKEQANWDIISCYCTRFAGTSCGSLPQFVSAFLGAEPLKNGKKTGIEAYNNYMKKRSLSGTKAIRDKGLQFGAWVEADLVKRPKPGDIYGLLDRDKTGQPLRDKKNDYIGHVGVILDATGSVWRTADLGQGDGYAAKIDVMRPYKAEVGELYGEVRHGGVSPYRVVAGWVDIDKYFAQ
jgi:hypothetical protein